MSQNRSKRMRAAAFAAIEMLEQRRLLSSVVSKLVPDPVNIGKNTLKVTGTSGSDYINVYEDPANNYAEVFNDKNHNGVEDSGETTDFNNANLDAIYIDSEQGNDKVRFELESNYDAASRTLEVDLGSGNDCFTFISPTTITGTVGSDTLAPDGADIVDHSNINMEIEGQENNDTIDIDMANTSISESSVTVNVDAGSGNDKVSFEAPNYQTDESIGLGVLKQDVKPAEIPPPPPLSERTDFQLQVDLGSGSNLYTQQMAVDISFATVNINVLGGSGYDKIQDDQNFQLLDDAIYNFTANLGAGNDYYNGEYDFSRFGIDIDQSSAATINIQGGDGNDRITIEGDDEVVTPVTTAEPQDTIPVDDSSIGGLLDITAYGGNGNDTMDMFTDTDHALYIDTDLGGEVRVVLSGDYGNDKVRLFLGATPDSAGDYDLSVLGAAGNDSVAAGFADETIDLPFVSPATTGSKVKPAIVPFSSGVTFGPSNGIVLDGGRGTDKYDTAEYYFLGFEPTINFIIRAVETLDGSLLPALPPIAP